MSIFQMETRNAFRKDGRLCRLPPGIINVWGNAPRSPFTDAATVWRTIGTSTHLTQTFDMNTPPCHLLPAAGLVRRPTPSLLHRLRLTIATLVALLAGGPAWAVDFAHDVVPILRVHCGTCHTGAARQGGFSLNTRETTLAGGDSGTPGFVAGKAAESELIARVTSTDPDYRMPSEGEPLPAEAIAVLKAWIDEQAVWTEGFSFQGEIYE